MVNENNQIVLIKRYHTITTAYKLLLINYF